MIRATTVARRDDHRLISSPMVRPHKNTQRRTKERCPDKVLLLQMVLLIKHLSIAANQAMQISC